MRSFHLLCVLLHVVFSTAASTPTSKEVRDGQTATLITFPTQPTDTGLKQIPDAAHPFIAPGPNDQRGRELLFSSDIVNPSSCLSACRAPHRYVLQCWLSNPDFSRHEHTCQPRLHPEKVGAIVHPSDGDAKKYAAASRPLRKSRSPWWRYAHFEHFPRSNINTFASRLTIWRSTLARSSLPRIW